MEIQAIIDKMQRKASQLGNPDYEWIYHDITLPANNVSFTDATLLEGETDYFYVIDKPTTVRIESKDSLYDTSLTVSAGNYTQQLHEHQGDLTITNLSTIATTRLTLIQQIFNPKQAQKEEGKEININILQQTNVSQ